MVAGGVGELINRAAITIMVAVDPSYELQVIFGIHVDLAGGVPGERTNGGGLIEGHFILVGENRRGEGSGEGQEHGGEQERRVESHGYSVE